MWMKSVYVLCVACVLGGCGPSVVVQQTPPPEKSPEVIQGAQPKAKKKQVADDAPPLVLSPEVSDVAERLAVNTAAWRAEPPPVHVATLEVRDEAGDVYALSVNTLDVRARIEGRMARVEVTQTFQNHLSAQTEGTYTFTLPAGASISRLAMDVDGQMVEGELVERERARNIYESIVHAKKDPALLEWQGGERFQTQIFPIPANGTKTVILAYDVLLPIHAQGITFEYALPKLQGDADSVPKKTSVVVDVVDTGGAAPPVVEGYAAARVDAVQGGYRVELAGEGLADGPLRLRFAPQAQGALRYATRTVDGEAQQFFALEHVLPVAAQAQALPNNLVIALDTSAGLGQPVLDQARISALLLAKSAPSGTQVRVVYGDLVAGSCAGDGGLEGLGDCLKKLDAGGASNLDALLQQAAVEAKALKGSTAIVLLSDGVPSVGELDVDLIASHFHKVLGEGGVSLHTVAIGHSPSESVLRVWANGHLGHALRMTPVDAPQAVVEALWARLQQPLVQDIQVKVLSGEVEHLSPAAAQNLPAGEPIVVRGRLLSPSAKIQITGQLGARTIVQEIELQPTKPSTDPLLSRFWARAALDVMDAKGEERADISALSVKYGVMSKYTSFLVLENEEAYENFRVERRRAAETLAANPAAPETLRKTDQDLQLMLSEDASTAKPSASGDVYQAADGTPVRSLSFDDDMLEGEALKMSGYGSGGGGAAGESFIGASVSPPRGAATPTLRIQEISVAGSFDKSIIQRVINQKRASLVDCYQRELIKRPEIQGTVHIKWTITSDGMVLGPQATSNTTGSEPLALCLTKSIKTWVFPKPQEESVVVTYPFSFSMEGGFVSGQPGEELTEEQRIKQMEDNLGELDSNEKLVLVLHYLKQSKHAKAEKVFGMLQRESAEWSAEDRYELYEDPIVREHFYKSWDALASELGPDDGSAADYLQAWIKRGDAARIAAHFKGADRYRQEELGAEVLKVLFTLKQPALAQEVFKQWASVCEDQDHRELLFLMSDAKELSDTRRALLRGWIEASTPALVTVSRRLLLAAVRAGFVREIIPTLESLCPTAKETWSPDEIEAVFVGRWTPSDAEFFSNRVEDVYDAHLALWVLGAVGEAHAKDVMEVRARCASLILPGLQDERTEARTSPDFLLKLALLKRGMGQHAQADRVLSEVVEFAPHHFESRVVYAEALRNMDRPVDACAQYAAAVQTNPAQRDAFREMMTLRRDFPEHAEPVKACIADGVSGLPVRRDLSVLLTWEDDSADIDLHITEAGGEHVFYSQNESARGGLLYYDITDGFGPEIYVLGSTEKGNYAFEVEYYNGHGNPVSGTLTVMTNAGAPNEERKTFPFTLKADDGRKPVYTHVVR